MVRRPAPQAAPERDREQTRDRILAAVGRLLASEGFEGLGVNAIAHAAGVDKVLLYRYFGGLPGLLQAYAERGDHWPTPDEITTAPVVAGATELAEGLVRFARALRRRPETLAILRWELHSRNELVDAIAAVREQQGVELLERVRAPRALDVPAVASLLSAGLTYLALRRRTADVYNGIDLRTDEGWGRLEDAVRTVVKAVFASGEPVKRPMAKRARAPKRLR
jgi:AcrR family transcriptional regulator